MATATTTTTTTHNNLQHKIDLSSSLELKNLKFKKINQANYNANNKVQNK